MVVSGFLTAVGGRSAQEGPGTRSHDLGGGAFILLMHLDPSPHGLNTSYFWQVPGKAWGRPCSTAGCEISLGQMDPGTTCHPSETLPGSLDIRASVSLFRAHAAPTPAQVSLQLVRLLVGCECVPSGIFHMDFHLATPPC